MRWPLYFAQVGVAVLSLACVSGGSTDRHRGDDVPFLRKTTIYETRESVIRYSVSLFPNSLRYFSCKIVVENLGHGPVFFYDARDVYSELASGNSSELHFSIGDPHLYSDNTVPRLSEVLPGRELVSEHVIDCMGPCTELNYIDVVFFVIARKVDRFYQLFHKLRPIGDRLELGVGAEWELFYDYLEPHVVDFPLVPLKP